MSRFPTAGHLASWAGMAPGNNITGGKRGSGKTTKGDVWLARHPHPMRLGRGPHPRHLPVSPVLAARPPHRQEESRRRRRPLDPGDLLAPAHQRRRLRRPRRRLLHPPNQPRPPPRPPHPPTPRPRLPSHPQTRRLTPARDPRHSRHSLRAPTVEAGISGVRQNPLLSRSFWWARGDLNFDFGVLDGFDPCQIMPLSWSFAKGRAELCLWITKRFYPSGRSFGRSPACGQRRENSTSALAIASAQRCGTEPTRDCSKSWRRPLGVEFGGFIICQGSAELAITTMTQVHHRRFRSGAQ